MTRKLIGIGILLFLFVNPGYAQDKTVYIVAIPGVAVGWVTNLSDVKQGAVDAAKGKSLPYFVINTLSSFINLVENPPADAIVVNCHGEVIPWDGSTEGTISNFIRKIATNVMNFGWRFVTVSGYPFYYWASGGTRTTIGTAGLNTFLSTAGFSASSGGAYAETGNQLLLGEWLETVAGIPLSSSLSFSRPLNWTGGFPEFVFYAGNYEGISAKQMESGYYVHSDGTGMGDYYKGYVAVVAAYLTYSSPPKTYFAINVPGAPSNWANAGTVYNAVVEALRKKGKGSVNLIPVNTVTRLTRLAENPPLNAKVINCHGENIPWDGNLRGGADDNAGCLNWISLLGSDTYGYGWDFIHVSGYPFYRCSKSDGTTVLVSGNGLSTFFAESAYTAQIYFVTDEIYMKQEKVDAASAIFGYTFPESIAVDRPIKVTGVEPLLCPFYSNGTGHYGGARFIFGTGSFLFIEGSGVSDVEKGRMAASFGFVECYKTWRYTGGGGSSGGGGCNLSPRANSYTYILIFTLLFAFNLTLRRKVVRL